MNRSMHPQMNNRVFINNNTNLNNINNNGIDRRNEQQSINGTNIEQYKSFRNEGQEPNINNEQIDRTI